MTHNWFRTTLMTALLSTTLATVAACNEEQVLYEEEGSEEIQVAQASQPATQPESQPAAEEMQLPPGHPPMDGMASGGGADLPPGHPQIDEGTGGEMRVHFAAPPEDRPMLAESAETVEKELHGIIFDVPADWQEVPKAELSRFRAAQFAIPAPQGGAEGAELVAYHFGPDQGGTAVANVSRWLGQLELNEEIEPKVYQHKVSGLDVTETYGVGTLKASMMGGSGEAEKNSALYGVIVEGGPEGSVFFKMTGGREAVDAAKPALVTMVRSLEATGPPPSESGEETSQDGSGAERKHPTIKKRIKLEHKPHE